MWWIFSYFQRFFRDFQTFFRQICLKIDFQTFFRRLKQSLNFKTSTENVLILRLYIFWSEFEKLCLKILRHSFSDIICLNLKLRRLKNVLNFKTSFSDIFWSENCLKNVWNNRTSLNHVLNRCISLKRKLRHSVVILRRK